MRKFTAVSQEAGKLGRATEEAVNQGSNIRFRLN